MRSRIGRAFTGLPFVVLCLCLAGPALAQRDWSKVEIRATHVDGSVYMLEGMGGNIGVSAGDDGILIIDDQFKPLAEKIRAALSEIHKGDLRFVLNTHYHGDHVGANEVFGTEATIIAHHNVRKRLSTKQISSRGEREPFPEEAWPVITFDASVSVHFNGEEIRVIHYPVGHTDGDSVIFFPESNVVHMGDHMFAGIFPYVDLEGGGTVAGYTKNIEAILERIPDDVQIIPGHGDLATKKDLEEVLRMLRETTATVEKKMKSGMSLDDIKAEGLHEWEAWSWEFIKTDFWIETIYKSLSD